MKGEGRAEFLRGISIFADLPPESVARIAERAEPRGLRASAGEDVLGPIRAD